jgi:hypothetical protein
MGNSGNAVEQGKAGSSFIVVQQLYCCSPVLLLFSSFTLFYGITTVPHLFNCSPTLLLLYSFTLENNSKAVEE